MSRAVIACLAGTSRLYALGVAWPLAVMLVLPRSHPGKMLWLAHCSGSAVTISTAGCRLFNVPAGCKLEAAAPEMAEWLQSPALETALAPYNKGDVLRGGLHSAGVSAAVPHLTVAAWCQA